MSTRGIGVGVVGLGFMGRTHLAAYRAADAAGLRNTLVAVCDQDPERRRGSVASGGNIQTSTASERLFDPALVRGYERPEQLFADPTVDVVSICTHTTTHVELALAALAAGKHVLLEKPVALDSRAAERVAQAAARSARLCMPAMCIRFWPAWAHLRRAVRSGELGAARSAVFRRLGSRPGWTGFYADYEQSGGALFDLHVHDVDFVRFCFGDPAALVSTGSLDHVTTLFHYPEGPAHVAAEGGWDHTNGWSFKMSFTVVFERATLDYEFGRANELVLVQDGKQTPVQLEALNGYDGEVRHLLQAIAAGSRTLDATMLDAVAHTKLIEAERESLRTRSYVAFAR
ncbi:MAG: Gfo/Idh/MocA family oxidoreductase [Planctomycetes bacterium]|nr:Gfo/Idh/MocA family oxidoreductase [Planctomycetota bacterium]